MDAGIDYGEKAVQLAPNDAATVGIISYLSGIAGAGCHSPDELVSIKSIGRMFVLNLIEVMNLQN